MRKRILVCQSKTSKEDLIDIVSQLPAEIEVAGNRVELMAKTETFRPNLLILDADSEEPAPLLNLPRLA